MTHEHMSDEQLSAHLDGEPFEVGGTTTPSDQGLGEQIAACDTCRRRLAQLSDARALLRAPVASVRSEVKAAAVDAALTGLFPTPVEDVAGKATVTPLVTAPRSSRMLVGSAAAAAVLLALAVGLPLGLSHSGTSASKTASQPVSTPSPTSHGTDAAPEKSPPSPGDVPDLGSVDSPKTVKSRISRLLASGRSSENPAAAGVPADTATQNQSDSASKSGSLFSTSVQLSAAANACVPVAHRTLGSSYPVSLVATATYNHVRALVIGVQIATTGSPIRHDAVVVAVSDCRTLARTKF